MTIGAAEAGKDIYCEKPLSLTVADGRAMVDAVRKHKRVLQTGSHSRSDAKIRHACELVRNGYLGEVRRVVTHVARNNKVGPGPGWQPMPVPDGFDYDTWLGPAPLAPYHVDRCLYRFRFNYDYSGGQITNFGRIQTTLPNGRLGMDDTGPVSVSSVYAEFPPEGSLFNTAEYTHFRCEYANGIVLDCFTAEPAMRMVFEGTEGMLRIDSEGENFVTIPEKLKAVKLGPNDVRLGTATDHQRDFLDCVKSRQDPSAPVEVGHRSATVCHLGNIVLRSGARDEVGPQNRAVQRPACRRGQRDAHARGPQSVGFIISPRGTQDTEKKKDFEQDEAEAAENSICYSSLCYLCFLLCKNSCSSSSCPPCLRGNSLLHIDEKVGCMPRRKMLIDAAWRRASRLMLV